MVRLKQRADFLAAAGGAKIATAGFVLQDRSRNDSGPARVGLTVSRKVGTAVERNRVRRRLREIVRQADGLRDGHDYVLVGRRSALSRRFAQMADDFKAALARVQHAKAGHSKMERSTMGRSPRTGGSPTATRRQQPDGNRADRDAPRPADKDEPMR